MRGVGHRAEPYWKEVDVSELQAPVTVVVLTYNEERNLPRCLESVAGWVQAIVVVDSGSTDGTLAVAQRHGAKLFQHPFETHAKQWNWALAHVPIETEWVLALDADHQVTPGLRAEIISALSGSNDQLDGYYLKRRQVFRGRWIKHGGYYPKYLLKLVRRTRVRSDENELVDFRFYVQGATRKLRHDLIEDNRNDDELDFWISKHVRFASIQAGEEHLRRTGRIPWGDRPCLLGSADQRVLWAKRLWYRMPLYLRPIGYFVYRYVFRLGFLDGKEGFVFHILQGFWYRLLVDIMIDERRRLGREGIDDQTGAGSERCLRRLS